MTQNTYSPKDYDTFIGIDVDKNSFAFTVKDHGTMNRAKKIPANPESLYNYGSFEFQVGEFNDSLEKIKPLLSRLGKSIDDFNAIEDAVNWLNKSIKPFQNYLNYMKNNKIDNKLISLTPKNFENFNNEQLQELASTFEGQRFKREILNQLYPQETPKRLKSLMITIFWKKEPFLGGRLDTFQSFGSCCRKRPPRVLTKKSKSAILF